MQQEVTAHARSTHGVHTPNARQAHGVRWDEEPGWPGTPRATQITDDVLARLRQLDTEATPPGWAWRQDEANATAAAKMPKGQQHPLLMALAGFHPHDEPQVGHFTHGVLKVRWDDIKNGRTLYNATPKPADAELIVEARNALPGLLDLVDRLRQENTDLKSLINKQV